jgi:hypothetical protein
MTNYYSGYSWHPPSVGGGGWRRVDRGGASNIMRGLAMVLVALLALAGLFSYLVLPAVIEDRLAQRLQEGFGLPAELDVEVSSSFPPEVLLGRVDRSEVAADQVSLRGFALGVARAELRGVSVSMAGLLRGSSGSRRKVAPCAPRCPRCRSTEKAQSASPTPA